MTRVARKLMLAASVAVGLAFAGLAPTLAREPDDGVIVGRGSYVRYLYPASLLENSAAQQFTALKQQANGKQALLPPNHPSVDRLRRIAKDLLPFADKWNPRA